MLVAFNVSQLSQWGYGNDTYFIDPMTPEFRPKDFSPSLYTKEAIMNKLEWFWNTNAYNHGNVGAVYSSLDGYSKDANDDPATQRQPLRRRSPQFRRPSGRSLI